MAPASAPATATATAKRISGLREEAFSRVKILGKWLWGMCKMAKKKADLQDPVKGEKMRSEHTEYMRGYRKKKKPNKDK